MRLILKYFSFSKESSKDPFKKASKLNNDYLDRIEEAANKGRTAINTYPEDTASDLAQQLETVAKLIDGGLQTRI